MLNERFSQYFINTSHMLTDIYVHSNIDPRFGKYCIRYVVEG